MEICIGHYDNTQNLISSLSFIGFFIIIFSIAYKNTKKAIKWHEENIPNSKS
ncbi:TPA: hypothetical protein RPV60_001658 [Campylobacter fetus subsp. venerealis]|nr:hypothetical protein [Campylobacter fetus subsp. venerealis]